MPETVPEWLINVLIGVIGFAVGVIGCVMWDVSRDQVQDR